MAKKSTSRNVKYNAQICVRIEEGKLAKLDSRAKERGLCAADLMRMVVDLLNGPDGRKIIAQHFLGQ